MNRPDYTEYYEQWDLVCNSLLAFKSAIRSECGQAFLKEMLEALDTLTELKLIANELEVDGNVCAIGAVGKTRGMDMTKIDLGNNETIADRFGIPDALVREIAYMNDEYCDWETETPEERFVRMRAWIVSNIRPTEPKPL